MAAKTAVLNSRPTRWTNERTATTELLRAAATGDDAAWRDVVDRYNTLVWWAVRRFRLGDEQSADIVQTTWLRLVENIGKIRDPERLGGWLTRTATRLGIAALRKAMREERLDDRDLNPGAEDGPELSALRIEQRAVLVRAMACLSGRDRTLLKLLIVDEIGYGQISRTLNMPKGSIGPTRARALHRLRSELADLDAVGAALD